MSTTRSWSGLLRLARERPEMAIGRPVTAHLKLLVSGPLQVIWETGAYLWPERATIIVSPSQCHLRVFGGPLRPELSNKVLEGEPDNLVQRFASLIHRVLEMQEAWARPLQTPESSLGSPAKAFYLAERGVFAFRQGSSLIAQAYEWGWPVTPLFEAPPRDPMCSLMAAVSLSPQWFIGLPYTQSDVEAAVPRSIRHLVDIVWHDADDIVPPCAVDTSCVLRPANVVRWL